MLCGFLILFSPLVLAQILTNENIGIAVEDWLSDATTAEATYGHISSWDVSGVTDMSSLFEYAYDFNDDISQWDVSNVTNMRQMFYRAESFNVDLPAWDVSRVTDMAAMFYGADAFNANISTWDTSAVLDMESMFAHADIFNGDISKWNVSRVYNMDWMFNFAKEFNADLSRWDVSNVTSMNFMFQHTDEFNSDLTYWDVSRVTGMMYMFAWANSFDGDISLWDVSNVRRMRMMFYQNLFNGDISDWDVSSVGDMESMFEYAFYFNGDLSRWDVSNVTTMSRMFCHAWQFNSSLSNWDVSSVCHMDSMFCSTPFNGDISRWDVSAVVKMDGMFNGAKNFSGDISKWDVSNVTSMSKMFYYARAFNGDLRWWDISGVTTFYRMFYYASSFDRLLCWNISDDADTNEMMNYTVNECYDCCEDCIELVEWAEGRSSETCPDSVHHAYGVGLCDKYNNPDYQKRLEIALANNLYKDCEHACIYDYESYDSSLPHAFRYVSSDNCYNVATGYFCIEQEQETMLEVHNYALTLCDLPTGAAQCLERVEWSQEVADSNCPEGFGSGGDKGYGTAKICNDSIRLYNGFYTSVVDLYAESFHLTLANNIFWSCSSTCMYDIVNVGTVVYNWKSDKWCWAMQTDYSCIKVHASEYEWAKEYINNDVCPEPTPAPVTYDCVERELDWNEGIANATCDSSSMGSTDKSYNAIVCDGYEDYQYRLNASLANRVFRSCDAWCVYDLYRSAEEAFIWKNTAQCWRSVTSGLCITSSERQDMTDYIDNVLCESLTTESPTCSPQMEWSESLMDEYCTIAETGSTFKHYSSNGREAVPCSEWAAFKDDLLKSLAMELYEDCSSWCVYDYSSDANQAWKWSSTQQCWKLTSSGVCFTDSDGNDSEEHLAAKQQLDYTCSESPTVSPTACIPEYSWSSIRAEELCPSESYGVANKSYGIQVCDNSVGREEQLFKSLANNFYSGCTSWCVYDYDTIRNNIATSSNDQGGFIWKTSFTPNCWQWVTGYFCFNDKSDEYDDVVDYADGLCALTS